MGVVVGGLSPIDNKDITKYPDLLKGLEKAAVEVKEAVNDNGNRKYGFLPNTLHVSSQVVQGTLYHVQAVMAPSGCSSQDITPILECSVDESDPFVQENTHSCTFNIWSRVWLPPPEKLLIENLKCSPKKLGG